MKMHLFRPGEVITMCGIQIKSSSTTDPSLVTCKRCSGMYRINADWYQRLAESERPRSRSLSDGRRRAGACGGTLRWPRVGRRKLRIRAMSLFMPDQYPTTPRLDHRKESRWN